MIALYYRTLGKIMINCSFSVDNVRFGVKPVSKDLKSFPTNLVVQYIRNLNCGKTYKWGGSVEGRKGGAGFYFTTTPTSDRDYLSVSHPFLYATHTHAPTLTPGSLTSNITPYVTSGVFEYGTEAR